MKVTLDKIINYFDKLLESTRKPLPPLPPPLILSGSNIRPGLSAREIAANIVARKTELGLPVGDVYQNNDNLEERMWEIAVEEIIKGYLKDAKIEVAIPPGTPVVTYGIGNLGAPVVSQGTTTSIVSGTGIIR